LNVPKDELNIEIIEPGSAGIFGLVGGRKARIKVTVENKTPEPAPVAPVIEGDVVAIARDSLKTIL